MLRFMTNICNRPAEVAAQCTAERELEPLVKTALVLVLGGTAAFGFVLGNVRDVSQGFATALKLPLVWVVSLAVCAPAFYAISAVFGRAMSLRATLALTLVASARASLLLFALLPVLWLLTDMTRGGPNQYHQVTFCSALAYGFAGLLSLGVLLRAFPLRRNVWGALLGFGLVFFLVSGQTAWSLRPFVGRPAEKDSPFLRPPEGTFVEALLVGSRSARGDYAREAPRPAEPSRYRSELEESE